MRFFLGGGGWIRGGGAGSAKEGNELRTQKVRGRVKS